MLKIKDDADLKELENFGFKPKYDEDNGELKAYLKKITKFEGLKITKKEVERKIRIFKFKKYDKKIEWIINYYFADYFNIDTLYDLIQAGLVEKVK